MKKYSLAVAPLLVAVLLWLGAIGGPANPSDVTIVEWLAQVRAASPTLTAAAIVLTQAGSVYGTLGAVIVAAGLLWRSAKRRSAVLLLGAVAIERLSMDVIKLLYDRPRPAIDLHPVVTSSSSYPSGHSANSLTAFVLVALLAVPSAYRKRAMAVAVPLALLVGMTRPYLGVHWPSDVIGGWALGGIAILAAMWIARAPSIAAEQQHQIVGGHRPTLDQG